MQTTQIQELARRLFEVHGTHSVAEAAQKAARLEQQGQRDEAQVWRRIEAALHLMKGPRAS